jgi:arylsulfatase A-like enzyme
VRSKKYEVRSEQEKTVRATILSIVAWLSCVSTLLAQPDPRPNFIVIFTDDQGYGDLGCYGSPNIATPNIDRLAANGLRFTSFYAGAPFCGPSRACLMTGCYAPRVSLAFNHIPKADTGIHPDEITLGEILKTRGYATMIIGKWHLGDHPRFLPTRHGFDEYYGLPYSNDMWFYHPRMPIGEHEQDERMIAARKRAAYTGFAGQGSFYPPGGGFPHPLPLISGEQVLELNPDLSKLTTSYTEKALDFITRNKDRSFFLYFAHAMPHVPLAVSAAREGKSKRGLYGDAIEEIDWSVGAITGKLNELGLEERTMIVYTSDNGPWLEYGIDGGSAGPLREGKNSAYEGGQRVPGIACWPGHIPAGSRTSEIAANIDLLPTFARLAGATLPDDRVIDGRDLWPLMAGDVAVSPHDNFYYLGGGRPGGAPNLTAVRDQRWKLHLARKDGQLVGTELYDLEGDISERRNRIKDHPDVAARLQASARTFAESLRANIRPLGRL